MGIYFKCGWSFLYTYPEWLVQKAQFYHNILYIRHILTPAQAVNSQTDERGSGDEENICIYTLVQPWLTAVFPMIKLTPLYQFIKNTFIYIYDKLLYK